MSPFRGGPRSWSPFRQDTHKSLREHNLRRNGDSAQLPTEVSPVSLSVENKARARPNSADAARARQLTATCASFVPYVTLLPGSTVPALNVTSALSSHLHIAFSSCQPPNVVQPTLHTFMAKPPRIKICTFKFKSTASTRIFRKHATNLCRLDVVIRDV